MDQIHHFFNVSKKSNLLIIIIMVGRSTLLGDALYMFILGFLFLFCSHLTKKKEE
jgi:uncharacterized membrane protein YqhA